MVYGTPLAIGTPSDDTVSTAKLQAGAVTPSKLSTGGPTWDTSGNLGIGTSSPTEKVTTAGALLSTAAASSLARDGAFVDYSGSYSRFVAGRAGGNYGSWQSYVAGASGVTLRHQIDYDSTFRWYAADGTTERMRLDSSGNFQFNSGYGSAAVAYGCRAWVNFNGTGTVAIRASGNVSSITDLGVGAYRANFTTAMPDANYITPAGVNFDTATAQGSSVQIDRGNQTTSYAYIEVRSAANTSDVDRAYIHLAIFR